MIRAYIYVNVEISCSNCFSSICPPPRAKLAAHACLTAPPPTCAPAALNHPAQGTRTILHASSPCQSAVASASGDPNPVGIIFVFCLFAACAPCTPPAHLPLLRLLAPLSQGCAVDPGGVASHLKLLLVKPTSFVLPTHLPPAHYTPSCLELRCGPRRRGIKHLERIRV